MKTICVQLRVGLYDISQPVSFSLAPCVCARNLYYGTLILPQVDPTTNTLTADVCTNKSAATNPIWLLPVVQSRKAVTAYLKSKQLPPFGLALSSAGIVWHENPPAPGLHQSRGSPAC